MGKDRLIKIDIGKNYYKGIWKGQEFEMIDNQLFLNGTLSENQNIKKEVISFSVAELNQLNIDDSGIYEEKDEAQPEASPSIPENEETRYYLVTDRSEADTVKKLGARWDGHVKRWYFTDAEKTSQFDKWIPKYLNVQYRDKDAVKKLGGRWDSVEKKWFYLNPEDREKFASWLTEGATAEPSSPAPTSAINDVSNIMERLEEGISNILSDEEFKKYLKVMAKMPDYSFRNTIMTYMQNPDATMVVAPKRMVRDFGYKIKESEKGNPIYLLRPNWINIPVDDVINRVDNSSKPVAVGTFIISKKDNNTYRIEEGNRGKDYSLNEIKSFLTGRKTFGKPNFIAFQAYDISQAEPVMVKGDNDELVEHEKAAETRAAIERQIKLANMDVAEHSNMDDVMKLYEAIARVSSVPITYDPSLGGERGYFSREGMKINITPSLAPTGALKTLAHEVVHSELHAEPTEDKRSDKEIQAEAVAYVICSHYGIDTSDYSFDYIAEWGKDREKVEKSFTIIQKTASNLIAKIDAELDLMKEMDIKSQGEYIQNPIFLGSVDSLQVPMQDSTPVQTTPELDLEAIKKGNVVAANMRYIPYENRYSMSLLYPDGSIETVNNPFITSADGIEKAAAEYMQRFSIHGSFEPEIKFFNESELEKISKELSAEKFSFFGEKPEEAAQAEAYENIVPFLVETIESKDANKMYSFRDIQAYTDIAAKNKLNVLAVKKMIMYDGIRGVSAGMSTFTSTLKEAEIIPDKNPVIEEFKQKTRELFDTPIVHSPDDIEDTVLDYLRVKIAINGLDIEIVDIAISGSRCRGLQHEGSDLDIVVEYKGDQREDAIFNIFNEDGLKIADIPVDINPITANQTGTLAEYLPGVENYLLEKKISLEKAISDEERWKEFSESHAKLLEEKNGDKKTLVINAFGGPGAGKTTSCLDITAELKKAGYVAEYVQEYVKELVWEQNWELLDGSQDHQFQILKEQMRRMDRLYGQVDFIVTDAPILLNYIYNNELTDSYENMLSELYSQYDSFNFIMERDISKFETEGRMQNLEESIEKDGEIKALLDKKGLSYEVHSHSTINEIVENAIKLHQEKNIEEKSVEQITNETEKHLVYYTKNLGGTGMDEDTVPVKYSSFEEALDSYINANVDGKELGCLVDGQHEVSLASFSTVDMKHTHINKAALVHNHPSLTPDDYEQISSNILLLENAIKKDDVYNKLLEGFDTVAASSLSSIIRSDSEWGSWFGRVVNQDKPQDYVEIDITGYSTHHQISYEIALVRDNNVVLSKMITAETKQEDFEQSVRNAFRTSKEEMLSYFKDCADVLDIDIDSHMEIYSPFSWHSLEEHYSLLEQSGYESMPNMPVENQEHTTNEPNKVGNDSFSIEGYDGIWTEVDRHQMPDGTILKAMESNSQDFGVLVYEDNTRFSVYERLDWNDIQTLYEGMKEYQMTKDAPEKEQSVSDIAEPELPERPAYQAEDDSQNNIDIDAMIEPYLDKLCREEISLIESYAAASGNITDIENCIKSTADKAYGINHNDRASVLLRSTVVLALENALNDNSLTDIQKNDLSFKLEAVKADLSADNPAKDVNVTVYQIRDGLENKYAGVSFAETKRYGIPIKLSNYAPVVNVHFPSVDNLNTVVDSVYEMGHTYDSSLNDVSLKKYEMDNATQKLKSVNVGDIIKISALDKKDMYYYIDNNGFVELSQEQLLQKIEPAKDIKEFRDNYSMNPVITLKTQFPDITMDQAKVMAQIDNDILSLPEKKADLSVFKENGIQLADKVLKYKSCIMVGSTESQTLKSGTVYALSRADSKFQTEELAITRIKEETNIPYGSDKTDVTLFLKDNGTILSYHTTYDLGKDNMQLSEFISKEIRNNMSLAKEAVSTGKVYGRPISSRESIQYKKNLESYKKMLSHLEHQKEKTQGSRTAEKGIIKKDSQAR
ncbi:MAG: AAA family ATPase [Lachnospiraceae bacterium]|nr:AAA family ATPase [Lachnospiraceae bacterium]